MSLNQAARPSAGQPFIMRPSVGQTGKVLGGALALGGGYIAIRMIRSWQDPSMRPLFVVLLAAMVGMIAIGYLLFFARARIEVNNERILKVSAFGGHRLFPLGDVGGIAFRTVRQPMSRAGDPTLGVVYGRDGRGLFTFSERLWDPNDVRRLAGLLGSRDDESAPSVSRREFQGEFPGAFNIWERHPYILGALLTVVLLIGVVALVSVKG